MRYSDIVSAAPGTNPELLKAAIMEAFEDIEKRLNALEPEKPKEREGDGS
jgi:hypothetical protein